MNKSTQDCLPCPKGGAGRPKACDAEARIHELIETAGRLFMKHGYTKVSLETIAREAHVAVRTIYVKFGGKAGLLNAVMNARRDRFLDLHDMETDQRPFKEFVDDFASHLLDLLTAPEPVCLQRVVIAEAPDNPDLARIFYDAGPKLVRAALERFFARPEVRAQLRDDLPFDQLPTFLITCISGDYVTRYLFPQNATREEAQRQLRERLDLFYRGVLRNG
jgi:TetR/AcrR family transcriptional regulator, mexJK operon transcriptional repressor